jgi:hypothetical protein
MDYLPVEGMDGYFRNIHSGAIINKNNNEYESYVTSRKQMNSDREKVQSLQSEVGSIKSDVDEIKSMLNTITDLLNK